MILTEDNFTIFAARFYNNPGCTTAEEFKEDLNRIKYLKKLFFLYKKKGILRERLILNHLTILYNVFEARACTKMLFLKLDEYQESLAPFLMLLGYLPDKVTGIGIENRVLYTQAIRLDPRVIMKIREIVRG
jgi:hypothetical protein